MKIINENLQGRKAFSITSTRTVVISKQSQNDNFPQIQFKR